MAWNPITAVETTEPFYFGPLSGYGTEELDRKGLDQDKKNTTGFKWTSKKDPHGKKDLPGAEPDPKENLKKEMSKEGQGHPEGHHEGQRPRQKDLDEVPTWDEFTQKTTFHGVRYIFDETPFRVRR